MPGREVCRIEHHLCVLRALMHRVGACKVDGLVHIARPGLSIVVEVGLNNIQREILGSVAMLIAS